MVDKGIIGSLLEEQLIKEVEEYKKKNNQLLHFAYTISHNLGVYIANIELISDLINASDEKNNADELEWLKVVCNDLTVMATDLSRILRVENGASVSKEFLDMFFYIERMEKVVNGYSFKEAIEFVNNVPFSTIVSFNPLYLESILLNLGTNAIKYSHPDRSPIIKFDFLMEGGKKVLMISDNGIGIDLENNADTLFELYSTCNNTEGGVGLYIVKKQIESMGCEFTVESAVGMGTVFKIYFDS